MRDNFTSTKVEEYKIGDAVRILDDIAKVHNLQENHGGWIDDMALVKKRASLSFSYHYCYCLECLPVSGSSGAGVPGLSHWRCPSWC